MTSGGLLVAVPADRAPDAPGVRIGTIAEEPAGAIRVF
jgi:hypothetical protein